MKNINNISSTFRKMKSITKVGILGTGNGAHVMAADLSLAGYKVYWGKIGVHKAVSWNKVKEQGYCELSGNPLVASKNGKTPIFYMTDSVAEIINETEIIFIVTTADRHNEYIKEMLKFKLDNKIIVFVPGRFACFSFSSIASQKNIPLNCILAETSCLPYVARIQEPGHIDCIGVKNKLPFSVFPGQLSDECFRVIKTFCPIITLVSNILETSILDHCSIMHPISVISNLESIKLNLNEGSGCYGYNQESGKIADMVDAEKMLIQRKLGIKVSSISSVLGAYYGVSGNKTYVSMKNVKHYKSIGCPKDLNTRYLKEDVPYGQGNRI